MTGAGGVGYGADDARVVTSAGASELRQASDPQITNQNLDDLTKTYNDISRRLKSLEQRTKPVTTEQKDKAKLRSLLEDAAKLQQDFDAATSARKKLQDAAKTQAETDRLDDFSLFEVPQRRKLENVQSTLVARSNTSLNGRLETLREDAEKFVAERGRRRMVLELRVTEAGEDLGLIQSALDSLARSADSFIKDLTTVQRSMTDDLADALEEIRILLKP
jgi:hypothetical protein